MFNFVTKNPYSGSNLEALMSADWSAPYWMTFKQAKDNGRTVIKGSEGVQLIRVVKKKIYDEETGEYKFKNVPKRFTVFNVEQTEEVSQ